MYSSFLSSMISTLESDKKCQRKKKSLEASSECKWFSSNEFPNFGERNSQKYFPKYFSFSTVAASSKGSKVIFFSFQKCIGGRRRENVKREKLPFFAFFLFLTSPPPSIRDPPSSSSSSFGVKIQSIAPSGVKGEKGKEGGGITNATKTNSLETDKKLRPYLILLLYSFMHRKKEDRR